MKFSICRNLKDNQPATFDEPWTEFVALLSEMAEESICGTSKEECKAKVLGLVACTFGNGGRRLKANATSAEFFWLDCEEGEPNELQKAIEGLTELGLESAAYTSAGHAPPADRFRIIVSLATPIVDHAEYRRVCLRLQAALGVSIDIGKVTMYSLLFQPARYSSAAENLFLHLPGTILSAAIRLAELSKAGVLDWATAMAVIREYGVGKIGWERKGEVEDILRYAWDAALPRKIKERMSNIDRLRMKAAKKRKELSYE